MKLTFLSTLAKLGIVAFAVLGVAGGCGTSDGAVADQWVSHWGPIERQVMSFKAEGLPESYASVPLGHVADRGSPHFDDAMTGWVGGGVSQDAPRGSRGRGGHRGADRHPAGPVRSRAKGKRRALARFLPFLRLL